MTGLKRMIARMTWGYTVLLILSLFFMPVEISNDVNRMRFILIILDLSWVVWSWSHESVRSWRILTALLPLSVVVFTLFILGHGDDFTLSIEFGLMVIGGVWLRVWELALLNLAIFCLEGIQISSMSRPEFFLHLPGLIGLLFSGWAFKALAVLYFRSQEHQKELKFRYEHDVLTQLYNRDAAVRKMMKKIQDREKFSVIYSDIHNFHGINRHFGPEIGDQVLLTFVEFCKNLMNEEFYIARYGADELLILMPEDKNPVEWMSWLRKHQKALYFKRDEQEFPIYADCGWAAFPADGESIQELILTAERRRASHAIVQGAGKRLSQVVNQDSGFYWSLFETLNSKDFYTRLHSESVALYLQRFAHYLHFEADPDELWLCGIFHDIGKLALPDRILKKPGALAQEEYEVMKGHPFAGFDLMKRWLEESSFIGLGILEHHERWDGKGYPRQLQGEDISRIGRMMAIVDAFSAMTLDRSYHRGKNKEEALVEIERCAGRQFDPTLAVLFVEMMRTQDFIVGDLMSAR